MELKGIALILFGILLCSSVWGTIGHGEVMVLGLVCGVVGLLMTLLSGVKKVITERLLRAAEKSRKTSQSSELEKI